ncbi:cysteine desulfurase-like protein [soil metagenome]
MRTDIPTPDLAPLRNGFPALQRTLAGAPCIFADAPGGTQVPDQVIDAMARYLREHNANSGGAFLSSEETDATIAAARDAAADFLGCNSHEIVFGGNMTTLAFALSRSLARRLQPGDEVVVTRLDHDANIAPWIAAAEDAGAAVRWVDFTSEDCTLDLASLDAALSPQTRVVAFALASNAVGTISRAHEVIRRARETEALVIADAVHFAPHRIIDVGALDVDVLFCSPYKFFGPHLGVMFARAELLDGLRPYKVRPSHDESPDRWETGTMNHEALAGFIATIDYIARLGREDGGAAGEGRRAEVVAGMEIIRRAERALSEAFLEGLPSVPGARLYGIGETARADERTPTFAISLGGRHPRDVAAELGARGIFVWDGNYYALALMERLGLEESGGAVRIGFCHYNTTDEVEQVLEELERLGRR